jgi:hypothetical protein
MSKPDLNTYGGKLMDLGYAGQPADFNNVVADTKVNEDAIAIDFGVAVCRGSTPDTCQAQQADGDKIIGISMKSVTMVADSSGNVNYAQKAAVPIMREGFIYAVAYQNVVVGDDVIAVTAQNGKLSGTTAGAAGAGRIAVPGAKWESTTSAGEVGLIRINN